MNKGDRKESMEALERITRSDWIVAGFGFIGGLVQIICGIIFWTKAGFLIIPGIGCILLGLLHLAWASKPKIGK